jgi:3-deoxy-7-phosphoheptulonate synthase
VLKQMATLPPLVFAGEARDLTAQLAAVADGKAFLLQAGDCAESFESFSADDIRDKLRVILQMAVVLTYSSGVPTVKVGRIAGQFAKPRSAPTEQVDGTELPSFRGHLVNDAAFTAAARAAQPERLVQAYHQSASTLNLLRAFTKGGFADLARVHVWNQEFVASSREGRRYERVADEIDRAMRFMKACGVDPATQPALHDVDFYTSHEALILGYEEALTRQDSLTGDWYDCSAHLLWIGERTRQIDGAHVEFLRGVGNPIGCKVGPDATTDEILALCERLNPDRIPGRLTLVARMGAGLVREALPPLLAAVRNAGHPVVWACDPMHGNTFTASGGQKTRRFDDILAEIAGFFAAHAAEGTWPGGVHVELTGDEVTECLGGAEEILDTDLGARYETVCDPRLNARQSVDLAFQVAELLRG